MHVKLKSDLDRNDEEDGGGAALIFIPYKLLL